MIGVDTVDCDLLWLSLRRVGGELVGIVVEVDIVEIVFVGVIFVMF